MGADGGLGIWETEAGCSGPRRSQGAPDASASQKVPGQSLEAHLYWRAEVEKISGIQKETMCGLDSVFASPGGPEEVPAFSPVASV